MSGQGTHVHTLKDLEAKEAREKEAKEAKEAREKQYLEHKAREKQAKEAKTSASMATTTAPKMSGQAVSPLNGQQDESIPEDMVIDPNSEAKSPSKPIDTVQDRNQQVPGTGTQHPAPPTQNILGDHGKQANNSGTQLRPKFTFSQTTPAPAPAPMPTTAPAPALAHTSGTQNIQGNYGEQANNSGNQDDPTFDFAGQGTQTPANNSGT